MSNSLDPVAPDKARDVFDAIQLAVHQKTAAEGNTRRRYEILADELRARILSGELGEGTALPGEREFVTRTGLGRGSVREAIRILESEGLISPKSPGRYGQSTVLPVTGQGVHRQLELFIRGGSVSAADLVEVRMAVEPPLARLAALNRNQEDIDRLLGITAAMKATPIEDNRALKKLNFDWHEALAQASHNELLRAFMTGIANVHHRVDNMETFGTPTYSREMIAAHERIESAIIAQEPEAAMRRMSRHLAAYSSGLAKHLPPDLPLDPND